QAGRSLHKLVWARLESAPDAVAGVSGDEHLSRGELARRAGGLAKELVQVGAGPDAVVGICAERSLEMIVGLLRVLSAGAAYLPLDPTYRPERLAFMVETAGAAAVLVQEHLEDRLPAGSVSRLRLHAGRTAETGPIPAAPEGLAYVIYTSGSTGAP